MATNVIQFSPVSAKQKIASAWRAYRQDGEPLGLALGRACYEYPFKSKGGNGSKGQGLVQVLDELNIRKQTAYYWMNRYEGKRPSDSEPEKPIRLSARQQDRLLTTATIVCDFDTGLRLRRRHS